MKRLKFGLLIGGVLLLVVLIGQSSAWAGCTYDPATGAIRCTTATPATDFHVNFSAEVTLKRIDTGWNKSPTNTPNTGSAFNFINAGGDKDFWFSYAPFPGVTASGYATDNIETMHQMPGTTLTLCGSGGDTGECGTLGIPGEVPEIPAGLLIPVLGAIGVGLCWIRRRVK
jgi:hypothetical protein